MPSQKKKGAVLLGRMPQVLDLDICSTLISLWSDFEYLGRHAHLVKSIG